MRRYASKRPAACKHPTRGCRPQASWNPGRWRTRRPVPPRLTEPAAAAHPPGALPPRYCSEGPRYATRLAHARAMARSRCSRQGPLRAFTAGDALPSLRPGRPVDHEARTGLAASMPPPEQGGHATHRVVPALPSGSRSHEGPAVKSNASKRPVGASQRPWQGRPGAATASLALASPQPARGMIGHKKRFEGTCPANNTSIEDEIAISDNLLAFLLDSRKGASKDAGMAVKGPFRAPEGHFCLAPPPARGITPPNRSITPAWRPSGNPR